MNRSEYTRALEEELRYLFYYRVNLLGDKFWELLDKNGEHKRARRILDLLREH